MRKTKTKRDAFWQAGTLPFILLWAISYGVAWGAVILLFELAPFTSSLTSTQANVLGISTVLLTSGLLQVQVVERLLKRSMRGWMLYTLIGTVITFFTFRNIEDGAMWPTALTVMSLLLPVPLVQTAWLWKRVRSAWLWPLASVVACLIFAMPLRGDTGQSTLIWAALIQGLVQGSVMRYLWTQEKDDEKARADFATHDVEDRIQRLQENEAAVLASISEEQNTYRRRL